MLILVLIKCHSTKVSSIFTEPCSVFSIFMRKTYYLASHLRWCDYISTLACQPTKPLIDFESSMVWEVNQGRAQFHAWIITDRVRSTTVRYCFHRCLSVYTSGGYAGQVQLGGGTPARSSQGSSGGIPCWGTLPWIPPSGLARGIPLPVGTPIGVPHLRYPPSDLAWGVPLQGGYPTSGTLPPPDLVKEYPCQGGYPTAGNRWSTWYAAVGMPLAFTQEDFLVIHVHKAFSHLSFSHLELGY